MLCTSSVYPPTSYKWCIEKQRQALYTKFTYPTLPDQYTKSKLPNQTKENKLHGVC